MRLKIPAAIAAFGRQTFYAIIVIALIGISPELFLLAGRSEAAEPQADLPPSVEALITCWEGDVPVYYAALSYDLPGEWFSSRGRRPLSKPNAWRIVLGPGEEVVTTAPCRVTRPLH